MAEAVLDANLLVAWLDKNDVHHARARERLEELETSGRELVLLDVIVGEVVSVLCCRARER
jgi:predicted nucleic acid-binding protein